MVFLWWCFFGRVVMWWCFCFGVVVFLCLCFCGVGGVSWGGVCVVVFLFWCGGVLVLVFLWWWWCFCFGVVVFLCLCFCGGGGGVFEVFLCFCGGVFFMFVCVKGRLSSLYREGMQRVLTTFSETPRRSKKYNIAKTGGHIVWNWLERGGDRCGMDSS